MRLPFLPGMLLAISACAGEPDLSSLTPGLQSAPRVAVDSSTVITLSIRNSFLEVAMASGIPASPAPGARLRPALAVIAFLLLATWMVLSAYQPPAARACLAEYHRAASPGDTARVDALVPAVDGNRGATARTCGAMRRMARWKP